MSGVHRQFPVLLARIWHGPTAAAFLRTKGSFGIPGAADTDQTTSDAELFRAVARTLPRTAAPRFARRSLLTAVFVVAVGALVTDTSGSERYLLAVETPEDGGLCPAVSDIPAATLQFLVGTEM